MCGQGSAPTTVCHGAQSFVNANARLIVTLHPYTQPTSRRLNPQLILCVFEQIVITSPKMSLSLIAYQNCQISSDDAKYVVTLLID